MYVCICRAVTERQIQDVVARGARSVRDLRDALGIVDECGRCAVCALECLQGAQAQAGCTATAHCATACPAS
jgi:bacterioferritin-associated ferredoxin